MEACFECRGLSKRFGNVQALDEVNISIMPGRVVGLLGPNGSGKTTLIKLANGLLTPDSGEIDVCGYKPGKESKALVSYLPGGSTNDFAASLNISSNPAEAAASAMRMKPRSLDVGKFGERNFVYVASFGAFTKTTYTVQQDIKNMFGHFAYLLEGVKNLDTLCPYRMKITADGEVFDGEYLFGAISNSTSIAGLMKLSPDEVSFDDGKFELLLVPVPRTPAAMQALILALINKDYYDSEGLIFRHVRHVTAETAEDIPWTLDGEYDPGAPVVEIGIEENGVTMLL